MSWCSVTRTVIGGRSNTCRRSIPTSGASRQVRAAARTRARLVPPPLVRVRDQRQRRPRMPGLPTRLAATLAAQRLRRRLGERRIRRRRLRRVPAVLPQPPLQLGVLGLATARSAQPAARPGPRAPHTTDADRQAPHHDHNPSEDQARHAAADLTSYDLTVPSKLGLAPYHWLTRLLLQ